MSHDCKQSLPSKAALLKVTNDLLMNMDKGHVSLLLLLELSAVSDNVDHGILLQSLQTKQGVCGTALSWFKSYLKRRSQRICIKETLSQPFDLKWGVLSRFLSRTAFVYYLYTRFVL